MSLSAFIFIIFFSVISYIAGYYTHLESQKKHNDGVLYILKARDDQSMPPNLYVKLNAPPGRIRNSQLVHMVARVKYIEKEILENEQF